MLPTEIRPMRCRAWSCFLLLAAASPALAQTVEFNRDIRPILSTHASPCHGPDNNLRKAKLRLDDPKDAHAKVIAAGKPAESDLFKRVVSTDPDERMPPAKANKDLS